jgi:putative phosphoesterase
MKKILLISDSHGLLMSDVLAHAEKADEIWHAGDWGGNESVFNQLLETGMTFRGVWGNIDSHGLRAILPYDTFFTVEGLKVYMLHIGGYPGRYAKGVKDKLKFLKPNLFICGHSHILKIIQDKELKILHMNPGACGNHGFHQVRTMIRFTIDNGKITQADVIELNKRAVL